ncbi:MAG: GDSL-type esterase/lipase family protein [Myxococcota bacterium]
MRLSAARAVCLVAALVVSSPLGTEALLAQAEAACWPAAPAAPKAVDRRGGAAPHHYHPLRQVMRRLGATGAPLESLCLEGDADVRGQCACARPALAHFADALDGAARGERQVRVTVFGNSLIASDGVTEVVRDRLVQRFGSGGPGFLLADRLADYGPRNRTAQRASGWWVETTADLERHTTPLGLAGAQHVSDGPASSRFALEGATEATVFWLDGPRMPKLSWRVDGKAWARLPGSGHGVQVSTVSLPEGARHFELRAPEAGAVVQGVSLRKPARGVVLDVFGVPSADAHLWLETDEALFSEQLGAQPPDLVMVMLGGNETKRIAWGSATRDTTEEDLRAFLSRTRAAAPEASCLVVGPIDSVVGGAAPPGAEPPEEPFRQRPQLEAVIAIERRVAREEGCAFFDLFAAMGGPGSLQRLHEAGLLHEDLTHPRQKGLDVLGQLVADALLDAYAATPVDASSAPPRRAGDRVATLPR